MAITTTITKPLDPGYMQVDANYKSGYKRFFKVPQNNAKNFAVELKKQEKDLRLYSNITFFSSIFIGVIGAALFTKNLDSRLKQFAVQTAAAIGLTGFTSYGFSKYATNEEEKLLKKHRAKEIYYRA